MFVLDIKFIIYVNIKYRIQFFIIKKMFYVISIQFLIKQNIILYF